MELGDRVRVTKDKTNRLNRVIAKAGSTGKLVGIRPNTRGEVYVLLDGYIKGMWLPLEILEKFDGNNVVSYVKKSYRRQANGNG